MIKRIEDIKEDDFICYQCDTCRDTADSCNCNSTINDNIEIEPR